jgi:hypothetical protein
MNSYDWISGAEIVGRLLRRTGCKDTSLIPDMVEWIAEAMQILQMTLTLQPSYEENIPVRFHKAKKPCGLRELWAIEYCGHRLPLNNTIRDPRVSWRPSPWDSTMDAVFVSGVTKENTPSGNFLYSSELDKIMELPWHRGHWYKIDGSHILTSFSEGYITPYFGRVPVDKEGYLMILDEGNFKEALTWFLRARLAGRGYVYGKPPLGEDYCDAKFETWTGRAKAEISFPSVEKVQAELDTLRDLMPNFGYYQSFFTGAGSERFI